MKVINIVMGIATAVILGALINLGIAAFYPAPVYPSYPPAAVVTRPCASGDTACVTAQGQAIQDQQQQYQQQEKTYEAAVKIYGRNLFIIANIIGIIMFALGFWFVFGITLPSLGVPIGIMFAGLWSIVYGYAAGWGSVGDQLKFFIGLVIAVLVIGGSMWLMQRYQKKHQLS
jgi:heme/copper-type cytochrome/quinol oxidase subunit 4